VFYWQRLAQNAVIRASLRECFSSVLLRGKILKNYKNFLAHTTGEGGRKRRDMLGNTEKNKERK